MALSSVNRFQITTYSILNIKWTHTAFIVIYLLKISLKSVQPKTTYKKKNEDTQCLVLAVCQQRRKRMTSLTFWWRHVRIIFHNLYISNNSCCSLFWQKWIYIETKPLDQRFSNLFITPHIYAANVSMNLCKCTVSASSACFALESSEWEFYCSVKLRSCFASHLTKSHFSWAGLVH